MCASQAVAACKCWRCNLNLGILASGTVLLTTTLDCLSMVDCIQNKFKARKIYMPSDFITNFSTLLSPMNILACLTNSHFHLDELLFFLLL